MPRFFVSPDNVSECSLCITGDDARHIARSLRMAVGDSLTVADGSGTEYDCSLTKIRDDMCECAINSARPSLSEPPYRLTLYMAYPKSDKLETVIQKSVELGCAHIVPFESSRCVKRPKADKAEERTARLCRIAAEAAKQCGRAILPTVALPCSFDTAIADAAEAELAIFCYEGESTRTLKDVLDACDGTPATVSVIIGSEGGFSPEEAEAARAAGLIPTGLGARILRCETAPDYCLSALSYRFEL